MILTTYIHWDDPTWDIQGGLLLTSYKWSYINPYKWLQKWRVTGVKKPYRIYNSTRITGSGAHLVLYIEWFVPHIPKEYGSSSNFKTVRQYPASIWDMFFSLYNPLVMGLGGCNPNYQSTHLELGGCFGWFSLVAFKRGHPSSAQQHTTFGWKGRGSKRVSPTPPLFPKKKRGEKNLVIFQKTKLN